MNFKPYKDIETAIKSYNNDRYLRTGEVKIKCHNNIYKDERSLIDAAILCKILTTFATHYNVLKQKYNIIHIGHLFWNYTTWQMKYKDATCTLEIHSCDFAGEPDYIKMPFEDCICNRADIDTYAYYINKNIDDVLSSLRSYAPNDRYNSIRENIQRICNYDQ